MSSSIRPFSEDELDALAAITPQDIEAARQWWRENAAPGFEDMLDATIDRGGIGEAFDATESA